MVTRELQANSRNIGHAPCSCSHSLMVQKDPFRNNAMPASLWGLNINWFISFLCFFCTSWRNGSMIVWTSSCPTECRSFKFWYSATFIPFACENIQTVFTTGMCDRCFEWNLLLMWPWLLMCLRLLSYFMQHPESNLYSKCTVPMTITKWGLFSNHFLPHLFFLTVFENSWKHFSSVDVLCSLSIM